MALIARPPNTTTASTAATAPTRFSHWRSRALPCGRSADRGVDDAPPGDVVERRRRNGQEVARLRERVPAVLDPAGVDVGVSVGPGLAGLGGRFAVERRAQPFVERVGGGGFGWMRDRFVGHGVRSVGRSAGSSRFPIRSASVARPRAIRDLTVPIGMPEHRGDLGIVEPRKVAQRHRGAVVGGKGRERGVDVETRIDRAGRVGNGRDITRVLGCDRSPLPPAGLVEGRVRGDAVHPRGETRPTVEAVDAPRDRDHRLLRGIERVFRMPEHAAAHRVDLIDVALEEDFERGALTEGRATREVFVTAFVGRAGHSRSADVQLRRRLARTASATIRTGPAARTSSRPLLRGRCARRRRVRSCRR